MIFVSGKFNSIEASKRENRIHAALKSYDSTKIIGRDSRPKHMNLIQGYALKKTAIAVN